jgi:hypothetical protein
VVPRKAGTLFDFRAKSRRELSILLIAAITCGFRSARWNAPTLSQRI